MKQQGWNFDNTYTQLPEMFYSRQQPAEPPRAQMAVFNRELALSMGLDAEGLAQTPGLLAGGGVPAGAQPVALAYAGYQFGHFAMLGDGRAVLLGEQITPDGRRLDVQLKGSGRTPYSRGGDGLAALLPMLREYIVSEAMHALGIPTTRSLAVVGTGGEVQREKMLEGAVLTRVAASHIRVGTFNYAAAFGTPGDVRALADYSIGRHFPWLESADEGERYVLFLREVAKRQAALIAKWQLTGFVHGVMNTDNMAISGETIDYGPCAFMDTFDPDTVFSSIDTAMRYAYKNQPGIGAWNLAKLAESILPLINADEDRAVELAKEEIAAYMRHYDECWLHGMRNKLGLTGDDPQDADLFASLLTLMHKHRLDYTSTFRALSRQEAFMPENAELAEWARKHAARLAQTNTSPQAASETMLRHNPAVIPRNHRVEEALAAAEEGDYTPMHSLLEVLHTPFEDSYVYSLPPEQGSCAYRTFCGT